MRAQCVKKYPLVFSIFRAGSYASLISHIRKVARPLYFRKENAFESYFWNLFYILPHKTSGKRIYSRLEFFACAVSGWLEKAKPYYFLKIARNVKKNHVILYSFYEKLALQNKSAIILEPILPSFRALRLNITKAINHAYFLIQQVCNSFNSCNTLSSCVSVPTPTDSQSS